MADGDDDEHKMAQILESRVDQAEHILSRQILPFQPQSVHCAVCSAQCTIYSVQCAEKMLKMYSVHTLCMSKK